MIFLATSVLKKSLIKVSLLSVIEFTMFSAGSTPITFPTPCSASGFNKTPSLLPNSTTIESFADGKNLEMISDAYSEKWSRRVLIAEEK